MTTSNLYSIMNYDTKRIRTRHKNKKTFWFFHLKSNNYYLSLCEFEFDFLNVVIRRNTMCVETMERWMLTITLWWPVKNKLEASGFDFLFEILQWLAFYTVLRPIINFIFCFAESFRGIVHNSPRRIVRAEDNFILHTD